MVRRVPSAAGRAAVVALALAACGGAEAPPDAGVGQVSGSGGNASQASDSAAQAAGSVELVREDYTYVGAARDPFLSLVEGDTELRPFLEDLRVTSIIFDERYPSRSVAVLRDMAMEERYQVRTGDELGRFRVTEITAGEVVLTMEDFGRTRQTVLSVRRQEGVS